MSDTKYQITKTVRFKLEPQFDSDVEKQRFIFSSVNVDIDTNCYKQEGCLVCVGSLIYYLVRTQRKYYTQNYTIKKHHIISRQVEYWCVIVEKEGRWYLYMISRDDSKNLKGAHKKITSNIESDNSNIFLYYFEPLTFRRLKKMYHKSYDNMCKENNNVSDKDNNKVRIDFYKKILRKFINDKSSSTFWKYRNIECFFNSEYQNIEDFSKALNKIKICYAKKVVVPIDFERCLKDDFRAICFEISSRDIKFKQNYGKNISNPNYSTRIWDLFWSEDNAKSHFPIRLNPIIKLFYRIPNPLMVLKFKSQNNNHPDWSNRYLQEQFTIAFSITENADCPYIDYSCGEVISGKRDQIIANKINNDFNNKITNVKFALGIDVGTDSLAFVSACDTNFKPIMFDVLEIKDLSYSKSNAELSARRGKDCKLFFVRDNPSYFLNINQFHKTFTGLDQNLCVAQQQMNEIYDDIFIKKVVASIDLTNAKVVNGQIVVNGDVSTHLKLKILKAKIQLARKIQEIYKYNPDNLTIYTENVDSKTYVKLLCNVPMSYTIINRKYNDKITNFDILKDLLLNRVPVCSQHLIIDEKMVYKFDEEEHVVGEMEITLEEFEYLTDVANMNISRSCFEKANNKKNDTGLKISKAIVALSKNSNINVFSQKGKFYVRKIFASRVTEAECSEFLKVFFIKNYINKELRKKLEAAKKNKNFEVFATSNSICVQFNEVSTLYIEEGDHRYNGIVSMTNIVQELNDFKNNNKFELSNLIDEINIYRKALVADMVGVLMNIFDQCKKNFDNSSVKGLIAFEGFDENKNVSDLLKFAGCITVPLRTALLKKMQERYLVPPFHEIDKISDENKFATIKAVESDRFEKGGDSKQFGIIMFVQEANTSQCCPLCGKTVDITAIGYPYKNKVGVGHSEHFMCYPKGGNPEKDRCGFCTDKSKFTSVDITKINPLLQMFSEMELIELFSTLDCNDKLASYNIAKRAIWNDD